MKKYKSNTVNEGTTIILDSVEEAIKIGESFNTQSKGFYISYDANTTWKDCVEAISKGDPEFKKKVEEIIDDLEGLVDNIEPQFSKTHSGCELSEDGIHASPEMFAMGEEKCFLKQKTTPFKLKRGSGDGAYRLIINTDICWWGTPEMNCALVGCLIIMLQRFAPVEVWIQQGWLGKNESDGITLFKLDFTVGTDITNLAFWICHNGKDIPFSYRINCVLGRKSSATSCHAEIESDLMLRGDWMAIFVGLDINDFKKKLYTDKLDIMAKWIAHSGMKIINENYETPPEIQE